MNLQSKNKQSKKSKKGNLIGIGLLCLYDR